MYLSLVAQKQDV